MTHPDDLDPLAMMELDDVDEQILTDLRALWTATDPPPAELAERIQFAMTVATLEADVARIVEESVATAGVRSTYERVNTVTFTSESVSAMIDIEVADSRVDVHGWVSESPIEVELRERHGSRTAMADATGRFVFENVDRGMVHFVFRQAGGGPARPVITPAIEL